MKTLQLTALTAAASLIGIGEAQAAFFDVAVPANAYITVGGLDWAWVSPCSPTPGNSCGDTNLFSFQATQGWRLPTAAEFAARPQASAFLISGANVPAGGTDPTTGATFFGQNPTAGACATPYFSGVHLHCDYGDGVSGFIFPADPFSTAETWAVRDARAVPEPATWAMMVAGFSMLGAAMRRRRVRTTVSVCV